MHAHRAERPLSLHVRESTDTLPITLLLNYAAPDEPEAGDEAAHHADTADEQARRGPAFHFDYGTTIATSTGEERDGGGSHGGGRGTGAGMDVNIVFHVDPAFALPEGVECPAEMPWPRNRKFYSIIERTARFLSSEDNQMEFVLKMKQGNNPHFGFLDIDHLFNPFFKHLCARVKAGAHTTLPPELKTLDDLGADGLPQSTPASADPMQTDAPPFDPSVRCGVG